MKNPFIDHFQIQITNLNNGTPTSYSLYEYWNSLWANSNQHNDNAARIMEETTQLRNVPDMPFSEITSDNITNVTKHTHNWKATGIDNLHNFWLKKFTCTHGLLAKHFSNFIKQPQSIPDFLTQGTTYMKPKDTDTINPSKYRPITCLPTLYKVLTACIAYQIYLHCENNIIIAEEQKGCRKLSQGCKEQLRIDSIVTEQAKHQKRNLYTTYIDYTKALDSVPHTRLLQVLTLYKINPTLVTFLSCVMKKWKTTLHLSINNNNIITHPISIK
jgi:hypothetical protein